MALQRLKLIGAPSTVKTGMQEPERMKVPIWSSEADEKWRIGIGKFSRNPNSTHNFTFHWWKTNYWIWGRWFPSENCRSQKFLVIPCCGETRSPRVTAKVGCLSTWTSGEWDAKIAKAFHTHTGPRMPNAHGLWSAHPRPWCRDATGMLQSQTKNHGCNRRFEMYIRNPIRPDVCGFIPYIHLQ